MKLNLETNMSPLPMCQIGIQIKTLNSDHGTCV